MPSRCAPAATAPQRRQQLRRRISQTWTSVIQRPGRSAVSGRLHRNPQTLLSFPATVLLLAPALRHNQQDNKLLKAFRVTFITHQPLALCSTVKRSLRYTKLRRGPLLFTHNSSLLSPSCCVFMSLAAGENCLKQSRLV